MDTKKILCCFGFAAVFSAAIISNASAADPNSSSRRKLIGAAAGGTGLLAVAYRLWKAAPISIWGGEEEEVRAYYVSTASTDACPFVVVHEVIGEYRVCAMFSSDDAEVNAQAANIFQDHVVSWVSGERVDFCQNSQRFANDFLTLLDNDSTFRGMPIQWLLIENENLEREPQVISGGNNPWLELRHNIELLDYRIWKHQGSQEAVQVVSADALAGRTIVLCGPNTYRFQKEHAQALAMKGSIIDQAQAQGAEGVLDFVAGQRGMNEKPLAAIVINFAFADGELDA